MAGSNILGRGFAIKKINLIIDKYPFINNDKNKALSLSIDDLKKIDGIAEISAKQFIEKLPEYYIFYESLGFKCKENNKENTNNVNILNPKINNKKFVFTGFRNKDYEKYIINNGGNISTIITKNVSYLIVKDKNNNSSKIKQAIKLNIPILSNQEFENTLYF